MVNKMAFLFFFFLLLSRGIAEVPENVSDNGSVAEILGEQGPEINELPSPVLGQVMHSFHILIISAVY
jgi:hypothetical protein